MAMYSTTKKVKVEDVIDVLQSMPKATVGDLLHHAGFSGSIQARHSKDNGIDITSEVAITTVSGAKTNGTNEKPKSMANVEDKAEVEVTNIALRDVVAVLRKMDVYEISSALRSAGKHGIYVVDNTTPRANLGVVYGVAGAVCRHAFKYPF